MVNHTFTEHLMPYGAESDDKSECQYGPHPFLLILLLLLMFFLSVCDPAGTTLVGEEEVAVVAVVGEGRMKRICSNDNTDPIQTSSQSNTVS